MTGETFGDRLREAREARGMTQAELAGRAVIASVHVSHFETGVKPAPSAATLVKLAGALQCSTDYLLGLGGGEDRERDFRNGWRAAMRRVQSFAYEQESRGTGRVTLRTSPLTPRSTQ
jgi:transcriptional regulator with XRE-family HTH domain